jgi:hypothetical protein
MKSRNVIMTGAALLFLAAPAFAGESTPTEKEATRQLNLQAARDAAPQTPQQVAVIDASARTAPAAAPIMPVETAAANGTLSSIANPPSKIATANVLDNTGKTVGAVQKIEVSPDGKPTKVSVALIGAKEQTVVLDASAVSYDAHKNEITAQTAIPSNG